jgi:hypothetical protein
VYASPDTNLWFFNTTTYQWTWYGINGGGTPVYPPTTGVEYTNGAYYPGMRIGASASYSNGYLYCFGGGAGSSIYG